MTVAHVSLLLSLSLPDKPLLVVAEDVEGEAMMLLVHDGVVLDVRPVIDDPADDREPIEMFMLARGATGRVDLALLSAVMDASKGLRFGPQ